MNWVHPIALVLATWLVAFVQTWLPGPRPLVHAQFDLLPALVVYAALNAGFPTTLAVAVLGGLGFDALSSGPFGLGVVPLVVLGAVLHWRRDVLLRNSAWAQAALGGAATFGVTLGSLLLLFVLWPVLSGWSNDPAYWPERRSGLAALPEPGFGLAWQLAVVTVGGAAGTPVVFAVFRWLDRLLTYQPAPRPNRRGDREIARGRT
jgi:rod shape-determining protein MreD